MNDIAYLQAFATKHKIVFQDEGECGFGRECVGLMHGNNYIDYNPRNLETYEQIEGAVCEIASKFAPSSAYHKHDCFVVLGRGDEAIKQLADWVRKLEEQGTVEIVEYETGATVIQAMISGIFGHALVVK